MFTKRKTRLKLAENCQSGDWMSNWPDRPNFLDWQLVGRVEIFCLVWSSNLKFVGIVFYMRTTVTGSTSHSGNGSPDHFVGRIRISWPFENTLDGFVVHRPVDEFSCCDEIRRAAKKFQIRWNFEILFFLNFSVRTWRICLSLLRHFRNSIVFSVARFNLPRHRISALFRSWQDEAFNLVVWIIVAQVCHHFTIRLQRKVLAAKIDKIFPFHAMLKTFISGNF